jgi:hypothetical protein
MNAYLQLLAAAAQINSTSFWLFFATVFLIDCLAVRGANYITTAAG